MVMVKKTERERADGWLVRKGFGGDGEGRMVERAVVVLMMLRVTGGG